MIDDALVREIRDRNNIVSVIGDYVTLRKAGTTYKGLCPFHNEKTPSFTCSEERQFYYCFGCQAGGDVIAFVREMGGYSFTEAVRHLADRVGIVVPEAPRRARGSNDAPGPDRTATQRPASKRAFRDACYHIGRLAQAFYRDRLLSMEGQSAMSYVRSRGLGQPAVERFGLGFAPDRWDGLVDHLREAGADLRVAEQLGLIGQRKKSSGYYDRFRNRLMFPVRNIAGEVLAFSGRDLSDDKEAAKYYNSPENPIYRKGDTLFGLHEARKAMRNASVAVVVEGNVDLVRLSVSGVEHVVAPLGTALTEAQCRLLRRFVPRVVLLYDGDRAGRAATLKAVPTCLAAGLSVQVAELPDGEDPDTYIGDGDIEPLRNLLAAASPGWEHLVDATVREQDAYADPGGPVRVIDALADTLLSIEDPRTRTLYLRNLAGALQLDEHTADRFLRQARRGRRRRVAQHRMDEASRSAPSPQTRPSIPPPIRELELLSLMLTSPECSALYAAHDVGTLLRHGGVKAAAEAWSQRWERGESQNQVEFIQGLDDRGVRDHLFKVMASAPASDDENSGENWSRPFEQLERGLRIARLERDLQQINRDLQQALRRADEEQSVALQLAKIELNKKLEHLRGARGA